MKHLYPTSIVGILLTVFFLQIFMQTATAQCPAGSITAANNGVYNNGNVACVSGNFSGNIKINNGAKLVIVNGGNFTGHIETASGSSIEVRAGGAFRPGTANNFAAALSVNQNGIVSFANVGLASGFTLTNEGAFTWSGSWNQNNAITVNNGACGTMIFSQGTSMQNGAVINNDGTLLFASELNTHSGTTINNRGRLTVNGNFNGAGRLNNQWKAVFNGGSNNFNDGDSIINLYTLVFRSAAQGSLKMRNEGLFWIGGSFQFNSGNIRMNRTDAQLRVNGALSNNASINGIGHVYIAGSWGTNGNLQGRNGSERLYLNQHITSNSTHTQHNSSMVAQDTTSFMGGAGNPAVCTQLLPMEVTEFKGAYKEGVITLQWVTVTESNSQQFDIEYSTDGRNYTKVGKVAASGNSNTRIPYQFKYARLSGTTHYFRLLLVDLDGTSEYTGSILVKTAPAQQLTVGLYPNPVTERLEVALQLNKALPVSVKIVDMNGRVVKGQQYNGNTGSNKYTLTGLDQLHKGIYLVEIAAGEEKWMQKIVR